MLTAGNLNIYAVVWSNICFALIVSVLNAIAIARFLHYRQEWKRTFLIPVIVSIIMGAAAYLVYQLFHLVFGNTISVLFAILAGVATYGIGLISFKGITVEDVYKRQAYVIALAIQGKQRSSEQLAAHMNELTVHGKSNICFVIGGSLGLSSQVLKRAEDVYKRQGLIGIIGKGLVSAAGQTLLIPGICLLTVSYTHLDVYKRQR